jgi:hypothetical protein
MEMIELDVKGLSMKTMRTNLNLDFLIAHPTFSSYPLLIKGF